MNHFETNTRTLKRVRLEPNNVGRLLTAEDYEDYKTGNQDSKTTTKWGHQAIRGALRNQVVLDARKEIKVKKKFRRVACFRTP